MTLRQFVTLTEAYDRVDVRRAMVVALARERPRSVEGYRRFYWAVSLRLLANSARASVPFGLQEWILENPRELDTEAEYRLLKSQCPRLKAC